MRIPCDILTDLLTDAQLDALADEAEVAERADAFLACLERAREVRAVADFTI